MEARSIKISLNGSEQQRLSVKFRYGGNGYVTPQIASIGASGEYTWSVSSISTLATVTKPQTGKSRGSGS